MKQAIPFMDINQREVVSYENYSFPLEIWIGNFSTLVNSRLPLHWHPEYEYGVVLKGHLIYSFQEYTVELGPGDCIFVNTDVLHSVYQKDSSDPVLMYTVAFPSTLLCQNEKSLLYQKYFLPELSLDFHGMKIDKNTSIGSSIYNLLQEIYNLHSSSNDFELQALSLVCRLWLETLYYLKSVDLTPYQQTSLYSKDSESIKLSLAFIYRHYHEKISIDDIASAAYISRNSCFRYFKNSFNKTPLEVLNEHRLSIATSLLDTNKSLTEIAISCGFQSSSYFSHFFKSKYGLSPQQYRSKLKK